MKDWQFISLLTVLVVALVVLIDIAGSLRLITKEPSRG